MPPVKKPGSMTLGRPGPRRPSVMARGRAQQIVFGEKYICTVTVFASDYRDLNRQSPASLFGNLDRDNPLT